VESEEHSLLFGKIVKKENSAFLLLFSVILAITNIKLHLLGTTTVIIK
jgi:hypothetical protein